jgi:hypothetical protein
MSDTVSPSTKMALNARSTHVQVTVVAPGPLPARPAERSVARRWKGAHHGGNRPAGVVTNTTTIEGPSGGVPMNIPTRLRNVVAVVELLLSAGAHNGAVNERSWLRTGSSEP